MNYIHLAAIALLSGAMAAITAKACASRWEGDFTKLCTIAVPLFLFVSAASLLFHGLNSHSIQTIALCSIFFYASYGDIRTHEADDFIHVFILLTALMNCRMEDIPVAVLTAVVLGGIMLLVAVIVRGMGIGGADIRFVAACAFLSNMMGGLFGLGLGSFIALLFNSPFRKKEGAGERFPMLPYLSCSYMLVYLLS